MNLFGKIFSKKAEPLRLEKDNYSTEIQESVRKWVSRFVQWSNVESDFWLYVEEFRKKNSTLPRVNDAIWAILNNHRMKAAEVLQFGSYSNLTKGMSNLLSIEGRNSDALIYVIEEITLDGTGLSLAGLWPDKGLVIDESLAYVAPASVSKLAWVSTSLGLSSLELKQRFMEESEICLRRLGSLKPKIKPEKIWLDIEPIVEATITQLQSKSKATKKRVTEPILQLIKN